MTLSHRKPTFAWQAVLILLPVAVMAAIGFVAILRDKAAVAQEAQQRAAELAEQLAPELGGRAGGHLQEMDVFSAVWLSHQFSEIEPRGRSYSLDEPSPPSWMPANTESRLEALLPNRLTVAEDGHLVWPPPYTAAPQPPPWFLTLSDEQRRAWEKLVQAQSGADQAARTEDALQEFIATVLSAEARANAEFLSLKTRLAGRSNAVAISEVESFVNTHKGMVAESGVPLSSLAAAEVLRLTRENRPASGAVDNTASGVKDLPGGWEPVLAWSLNEPSTLTSELLDQYESISPAPTNIFVYHKDAARAAKAVWSGEEKLREIAEALEQDGKLPGLGPTSFWLHTAQQSWFCVATSNQFANQFTDVRIYSKATVEQAFARAVRDAKIPIPEFFGLAVEMEGESLNLSRNSSLRRPLAEASGRLTKPGPRFNDLEISIPVPGVQDKAKHRAKTEAEVAEIQNAIAAYRAKYSSHPSSDLSASDSNVNLNALYGALLGTNTASNADFQPLDGSDSIGSGLFTLHVYLADANLLFARQQQRTLLFGGLILLSAFAAVVGLAAAYRAFRRQLRLSDMKSNFVSSVSHELRAPIASVRLMAESLERGKIPDTVKQREYFHFISQECRRLSSLIENVLDFSRIDQGRKQYEFEPTDIVALTQQTVKFMEPCATEKEVQLAFSLDSPELSTLNHQLWADGKALQQALINLIDNAIKHSPKGETVTVGMEVRSPRSTVHAGESTVQSPKSGERIPKAEHATRNTQHASAPSTPDTRPSSSLALWVEDHGPGIPPKEHEKIFERFYRLGSELRRETQGVGIGLSIVAHVVEAHGGRVTVRSDVGQGSRFTIELPMTNDKETKEQS